jgi:hypothetical protein
MKVASSDIRASSEEQADSRAPDVKNVYFVIRM